PQLFDTLVGRAGESAAAGIRPPQFAWQGVIDQSSKVVAGAPFGDGPDSALWADAQAKADALAEAGTVTAERATELKEDARKALVEAVKPAYDRLIAFAGDELPRAAVNPAGVGQTHPEGAAYYAFQLKQNTSTDMGADEVHDLGLAEVARLRGELATARSQYTVEGDLQSLLTPWHAVPWRVYPRTGPGRQEDIVDATA